MHNFRIEKFLELSIGDIIKIDFEPDRLFMVAKKGEISIINPDWSFHEVICIAGDSPRTRLWLDQMYFTTVVYKDAEINTN